MKSAAYHYRRTPYHQRRIEAPPERVIEEPLARQERESGEPWVPVPSRTPPARSIPAIHVVQPCRIDVRLRQVLRPQAAPAVQVVVLLNRLRIESARLSLGTGQLHLVIFLYRRVPVIRSHDCLAIEHSNLLIRGIKVVQTSL